VDSDSRQAADGTGRWPEVDGPFRLGAWIVDPGVNRIRQADNEVRLEPKVMRVLVLLAERHGQVVSRRELEDRVWPHMLVTNDSVTNTLIKLRKALGDDARNPTCIETIAKSGYRLIADVSPLERPSQVPPSPSTSTSGQVSDSADESPVATRAASRSAWRITSLPALSLMLALMLALGWLMSRQFQADPKDDLTEFSVHRTVAVLPFENLTRDPEQDYFANGITEDLITDLSQVSSLRVVARNSAMAYRNSTDSDRQIGAELSVRYIVRGSVQRSGQRLRINVRLTDTRENRNRWAERYDRELSDIFSLQDEITARVVSALEIELVPGERQRLTRNYGASLEAYDELLRGLDLLGRRSGDDNDEAKVHFQQAIALEPQFARAYAGLAQAYAQDAIYDRGPAAEQSLVQAETLARKGLEIDDGLSQLRFVISMVEMFKGNLDSATTEVLRAIELKPSYADGYGLLARIMDFAGRPHEGLEAIDQAIQMNPQAPALYRMVRGALLYQLRRNGEALEELTASVSASPNLLLGRLYLAASYAASNQLEEARWEVDEILSYNPEFTVAYLEYGFPIRDQALRKRFLGDLRLAGLPEG